MGLFGGFMFMNFFGLVLLLGVIFFLVWAFRTLDKKQLKNWTVGLLVVGFVGLILCGVVAAVKFKDGDFKKLAGKKWGCSDEAEEETAAK